MQSLERKPYNGPKCYLIYPETFKIFNDFKLALYVCVNWIFNTVKRESFVDLGIDLDALWMWNTYFFCAWKSSVIIGGC